MPNVSNRKQLTIFHQSLIEARENKDDYTHPKDWLEAFRRLRHILSISQNKQKRIILDEIPWLDTPRSDFIAALEHFWNTWASARNDIMLIVCGSDSNWMTNKLFNNIGGLHNRVTDRIDLSPFNLQET